VLVLSLTGGAAAVADGDGPETSSMGSRVAPATMRKLFDHPRLRTFSAVPDAGE
jgi:hypothetical protein